MIFQGGFGPPVPLWIPAWTLSLRQTPYDWLGKPCDTKGGIFLSHPHTDDRFLKSTSYKIVCPVTKLLSVCIIIALNAFMSMNRIFLSLHVNFLNIPKARDGMFCHSNHCLILVTRERKLLLHKSLKLTIDSEKHLIRSSLKKVGSYFLLKLKASLV